MQPVLNMMQPMLNMMQPVLIMMQPVLIMMQPVLSMLRPSTVGATPNQPPALTWSQEVKVKGGGCCIGSNDRKPVNASPTPNKSWMSSSCFLPFWGILIIQPTYTATLSLLWAYICMYLNWLQYLACYGVLFFCVTQTPNCGVWWTAMNCCCQINEQVMIKDPES